MSTMTDARRARVGATHPALRARRAGARQHRPLAPVVRLAPVIPLVPVRAGRRATSRTSAPPPLRLTRRGRVVLRLATGVLLLGAVVGGVLGLIRPADAGTQVIPVPVSYHVVLPGETLWSIARESVPGADPREVVARIVELNALPGAGLTAGQRIAVPVVPARG
jgi:hypothetical protein